MGVREFRIQLDGTLEMRQTAFPGVAIVAAEQMRSEQKAVARLAIDGTLPVQAGPLAFRQFEPNLTHDATRDVVLHEQGIIELSVEACRPQVGVGRGVHELHDDPDPVCGPRHRPFQDGIDSKLRGDLRQRLWRPLVVCDRRARNDFERSKPRQARDDRLGHAVGEVLLFRIARQVHQRQDRQPSDGLQGRALGRRRRRESPRAGGLIQPPGNETQLGSHGGGRRRTIGVIFRQRPLDQVFQCPRRVLPQAPERRGIVTEYRGDQRRDGGRLVRPLTRGHFEQHRAQGKQVGSCIARPTLELLGRHVGDRTRESLGALPRFGRIRACVLRAAATQLRDTEVEKFRADVGQHDVGRLEVAMDHSVPVGCVQSIRDLDSVPDQARER